MITEYIFIVFLIILGLAIMRFGIFQIRKFKEGKTKIRKKLSEQIGFLFFFIHVNKYTFLLLAVMGLQRFFHRVIVVRQN